ncbi:MAG: aminotransferase class III-fold pyridoxal phosphate-dependent enzyme [Candidatus Latescibacteria bacterium]|nr:aminotransferase class III-fold pyridoxal phosphate-dependent enzyme [bacterium]MBD3424938.1 aminotransferase class III-fold pyridoxal phosphate-dependent enzyme [Candidatus Latescibacterota bacterium]
MTSDPVSMLEELRQFGGERETEGLPDETINSFCKRDETLIKAIEQGVEEHRRLRDEFGEELGLPERKLRDRVQSDLENFYPRNTRNPFVAIAAAGPWIVTSHGAVLHDSAGYGMLGMGHSDPKLLEAMGRPWVMANVMTPQFSQKRFSDRLKKEIGHTRGSCPFSNFICMNSGSESVSVASRIADINALRHTGTGGRHEGKEVKQLAVEEGFHGRTYRAASVSDSTMEIYRENLASFQDSSTLVTVPINDLDALKEAFEKAEKDNIFFEAMYIEPVMGEGEPGRAVSRKFYDLARKLTADSGTMFIVDSIQAAIRAQGCLSIIDYPGFEDCDPPDCETYSKALNAGQYPLSVIALNDEYSEIYVPGVYGNTMTTNPRALEVGCAVLDGITDELRENIRKRGSEFLSKLEQLSEEFPGAITSISGTGLIINAELNPDHYSVVDREGFEYYLRVHGIEMIHGGHNGIRFTPHFAVTSEEIDLIIDMIRKGLTELA